MDDTLRQKISSYTTRGLRVLLVAQSRDTLPQSRTELPSALSAFALIVLADHVRQSARATFAFFKEQGVEIKVISGDDPQTVSTIAAMAGIENASRLVDMSKIAEGESLDELMATHTVFGRTSPAQKQEMIRALKRRGRMVGMTGDGVNDVMALREADVGVAMASGADAARTVADFVLVDSDFSSMVQVVKEGRRIVNNIEAMASLYIVKTLYSVILTILFILLPFDYPFQPIQLTLLNMLMGAVPSFFLMFEPNYHPMNDRFAHRLVKDAVPAALLVVLNIIVVQIIGTFIALTPVQLSTLCVLLNGAIRIFLLLRVCQPYNAAKRVLVGALIVGYLCGFVFLGSFFELAPVFNELALIWVPLVALSYPLYQGLTKVALRIERWWLDRQYASAGAFLSTPR
jgi:cation-transporting ATPase E